MTVDYDLITEIGGTAITDEAASMVYTRYAMAAGLAQGRRTLEIGCASGVGLGLLARTAANVVGGDVHAPMLRHAATHYGRRVSFAQFSATALPFADSSFDFVLFLEASYYVEDFPSALDEITRVLASAGAVLFVNANPDRPDFIRSPYSHHYHSASEFRRLLEERGYRVKTFAGFALGSPTHRAVGGRLIERVLPPARRVASALHLVPKTLKGRARLKRMIFGKVRPLPVELPEFFAPIEPLVPAAASPLATHKVIYVIGELPQGAIAVTQ